MSHDGDETACRRRRRRRDAATVATKLAGAPPSSDDILWEIFLRLPTSPSCLPRVSLVCKRWRRLAADPEFLRRFREHHHRNGPHLGLFDKCNSGSRWVSFSPVLDPPNRAAEIYPHYGLLLGCRHGRVLVLDPRWSELLVCEPITGERCRIALPREFGTGHMTEGAVICANGDKGHVHGGCHSNPFKVVLVRSFETGRRARPSACVYSSETGTWSNLISMPKEKKSYIDSNRPATLVGDCLYWWILYSTAKMEILEFDIGRQSLSVIDMPHNLNFVMHPCQIIQGEDGGIGLAILSYPSLQIWDRKMGFDGEVATWVLRNTVNLDLVPNVRARETDIVGYVEEENAILIKVNQNVFIIHLASTHPNKLCESIETHGSSFHKFLLFRRVWSLQGSGKPPKYSSSH